MKISWRRLEDVLKTSWRRLQDILMTFLQDVLKKFWRRLENVLVRRLEDVLKTSYRCLEDVLQMSWRRLQDILMTFMQDVFWRRMSKVNIFVLMKTSSEDEGERRLHQDECLLSYIRYFIYSDFMWRHVCAICNSIIFT